MNCPNCGAENPSDNQFCMNCGTPLHESAATANPGNYSPGNALLIATGQVLLAIFGLYLLRTILTSLSFIEEMRIPGLTITTGEIISILIFILIVILILRFARTVAYLWPRAFPRYAAITVVINAVLYVIVLSVLYDVLRPIFDELFVESEPLLILQILLALVTLVILGRAAILVYQSLPSWLESLRVEISTPTTPTEPEK